MTVDLSRYVGDIEHQLWLNSCVAHAGTTLMEMLYAMRGENVELDRTFLYYVLRDIGGYDIDGNTWTREEDLGTALVEIGVPKSSWLDDILYFVSTVFGAWKHKPSKRRYKAAEKYRLDDFWAVDDIRAELDAGRPVIVGMKIRKAFKTCEWNHYQDSPVYDQHAVLVVGYGENDYLIVNSWGRDWGKNGMAWMPKNLVEADCYGKWTGKL
jgi:hypothetical protein